MAVVTLGVASAIYGALVGRVQSDVKTALAFASLTQVGIITAEIGLGLRYIALIHIIGHAHFQEEQAEHALEHRDQERIVHIGDACALQAADVSHHNAAKKQIKAGVQKHFVQDLGAEDARRTSPGRRERSLLGMRFFLFSDGSCHTG